MSPDAGFFIAVNYYDIASTAWISGNNNLINNLQRGIACEITSRAFQIIATL